MIKKLFVLIFYEENIRLYYLQYILIYYIPGSYLVLLFDEEKKSVCSTVYMCVCVSGTNDLDYYILYLYMIHFIGLKKIFHHCGYIKKIWYK